MKFVCDICGWIYDEELGYEDGGIAPDDAMLTLQVEAIEE